MFEFAGCFSVICCLLVCFWHYLICSLNLLQMRWVALIFDAVVLRDLVFVVLVFVIFCCF